MCVAGVCLAVYGTRCRLGSLGVLLHGAAIDGASRVHGSAAGCVCRTAAVMLPPLWFSLRILKGDAADPCQGIRSSGGLPCSFSWWRFSGERISRSRSRRRGDGDRRRHPPPDVRPSSGTGRVSVLLFFCCMLHYFLSRVDWDHFRVLPVVAAFLLPLLVMSGHEAGRAKFRTDHGARARPSPS